MAPVNGSCESERGRGHAFEPRARRHLAFPLVPLLHLLERRLQLLVLMLEGGLALRHGRVDLILRAILLAAGSRRRRAQMAVKGCSRGRSEGSEMAAGDHSDGHQGARDGSCRTLRTKLDGDGW